MSTTGLQQKITPKRVTQTCPALLLLFRTRAEVSRKCMSTNAVLIGMGALDDKELFVIEGSEN